MSPLSFLLIASLTIGGSFVSAEPQLFPGLGDLIPGLGNIPGIGDLFPGNDDDSADDSSLFVTILKLITGALPYNLDTFNTVMNHIDELDPTIRDALLAAINAFTNSDGSLFSALAELLNSLDINNPEELIEAISKIPDYITEESVTALLGDIEEALRGLSLDDASDILGSQSTSGVLDSLLKKISGLATEADEVLIRSAELVNEAETELAVIFGMLADLAGQELAFMRILFENITTALNETDGVAAKATKKNAQCSKSGTASLYAYGMCMMKAFTIDELGIYDIET